MNAATKCMAFEFYRQGRDPIIAVALHPGYVRTNIGGPQAAIEVGFLCAGPLL